jgi:thiol-disulfide isomerase/thioredoxin
VHADSPGIAWFNGNVDEAFASAKASNKPVLLYWGAQWCPPCKQLKSAVFNRPDFIEKSKLFVAVYLDGDLPDAQKWGDEFRVTGYPTVVVFKPDRTEITRIAGNMDLSLYAGVLDNVLGDVRPVKDVIELAVKGDAPLAADDCRRLAYHAFGLEDDGIFPAAKLQTRLRERSAYLSGRPDARTRPPAHPRRAAGHGAADGRTQERPGRPTRRSPCPSCASMNC